MAQVQQQVSKQARKRSSKRPGKKAPTKAERQQQALSRLVSVAERSADSIWDAKIALGRAILAADDTGVTRKRQMAALSESPRWAHIRDVMSLSNASALSKLAKMAEQLGDSEELQTAVGKLGLSNDDAHALASRMGRGLIRYSTVIRKLGSDVSDSEKKAWVKEVIASGKQPRTGSSGSSKVAVSKEVKSRILKLAETHGLSVDELITEALDELESTLG